MPEKPLTRKDVEEIFSDALEKFVKVVMKGFQDLNEKLDLMTMRVSKNEEDQDISKRELSVLNRKTSHLEKTKADRTELREMELKLGK